MSQRLDNGMSGDGRAMPNKLGWQVGTWPTPGANDHKGTGREGQRRGQLDEAAEQKFRCSHPDPVSLSDGHASSSAHRRLNPRFVAWLMGWPRIDETGFGFSATAWWISKARMRSALCSLICERSSETVGHPSLFDV